MEKYFATENEGEEHGIKYINKGPKWTGGHRLIYKLVAGYNLVYLFPIFMVSFASYV